MRVTPSLTLPNELERARASGELVVFAGAGVSMGPPSHLPNFEKLAREIAEPALTLRDSDEEALDRYLGRAERMGVKVQTRARENLLRRGGTHTPLHEHLLSLFPSPEAVRLITTNFDPHFSTAARAVFGAAPIREYVGPALPPGKDFRGIAQLHGSLGNTQDRLVLTDSDFAAAYMVDGWAARFLVGVFAWRTILFVGYSLTDPVMRYLLHAIPPTNRWFGLTHVEEQPQWAEHDIAVVTFETREDGDRYGELNDGLERWAWYARASVSDHDLKLRSMIRVGPPASPEGADYLRARLETEVGRQTFWTEASDEAWLAWASEEGLLEGLFQENPSHLNEQELSAWAYWCLTRFCEGGTPPLLALFRKKSVRVSAVFARELAAYLLHVQTLPPEPVLRQLIALLVNRPAADGRGRSSVAHLIGNLIACDRRVEALALLRWATGVRLQTRDTFFDLSDENEPLPELPNLSTRVSLAVPADELLWILRNHGDKLAAIAAAEIVALGEQRLADAYHLLDLASGAADSIDWLSFGRTAIAPSNQDLGAHAEDVLVVLVRCGLLYWREQAPDELLRFAERVSMDKRLLLKRLGIYALGEARSVAPEAVLALAARERWAGNIWVRPELYHLLKAHYRAASEEAKAGFIAALREDATWSDLGDHHADARFGIANLLYGLSPGSDVTRTFVEAERAAHPEWSPERHDPDGYLSRVEVGVGGGAPSPFEPEQMTRLSSDEAYSLIAEHLERHGRSDTSHALLGAVQQAARTDASWGVQMITARAGGSTAPVTIAEWVLWGLRDASATPADQQALLAVFGGWNWDEELTVPIGVVLDQWARSIKGSDTDPNLLDAFDHAADALYERALTMLPTVQGTSGFYESATSHPAGQAARVWWVTAHARNWSSGQFVLSVSQAERDRWGRVLPELLPGGIFARAILGYACDRFSVGDFSWAEQELFPRFDPASEDLLCGPLWDGRLMQQHWSWVTVAGLRPYLSEFLVHSAKLAPRRAERLGDVVALFVAHPDDSHFSYADLLTFAQYSLPEARRAFASSLPKHVAELTPELRRTLWSTTLRRYLNDRRTNVPVALDSQEVVAMLEWVIACPEVAHDILAELVQTDAQELPDSDHILWKLSGEDSGWVRSHPTEAVALIRWLAERKSIKPWSAADAVDQLETALDAGAAPNHVRAAAEAIAALPSNAANSLLERLRGSPADDGGKEK